MSRGGSPIEPTEISVLSAYGRKSYVGTGNSSYALPMTLKDGSCGGGDDEVDLGQSGSELYNFERTVADVKKKIEDALNTFGLGGAGPGEGAKNRRRRKRRQLQVGQSNGEWACAKVVLPGDGIPLLCQENGRLPSELIERNQRNKNPSQIWDLI